MTNTPQTPPSGKPTAELERRVLHGLSLEWEAALWILPPTLRRRMLKPFFTLRDLASRLGYWHRGRAEIGLSRRLVLDYAWDSVREVLLHEMAHQLADQVLGAGTETPHGPKFQEACHLLRANPEASGRFRPLAERLRAETLGEEDRRLLRIGKLMALAQSRNRHEAEAAMAKAHELMARYNLGVLERVRRRTFVSVFVGVPALRQPREAYHLARLLQDFYFVEGLWVPAFVLARGKMGRVLEISGTPPNIQTASYVHDFVGHFIRRQWSHYNREKGLNRRRLTDFAVGIVEGFRAKLQQQHDQKWTDDAAGLPLEIQDPQLSAYLTHRYPRIRRFSRNVSNQDQTVLRDGMRIGREMVVCRGISDQGGEGGGKRLTGPNA
jgi:hypothetical protein